MSDCFFVKASSLKCDDDMRAMSIIDTGSKASAVTFNGSRFATWDLGTAKNITARDYVDESLGFIVLGRVDDYCGPIYLLFVVRQQKYVVVFDEELEPIKSLELYTGVTVSSVCFLEKCGKLFVSGTLGALKAFDFQGKDKPGWVKSWTRRDSSQCIKHLTLDDTTDTLFGAAGLEVFQWNAVTGERMLKFQTNHIMTINSMKFLPDQGFLMTAGHDGRVSAWQTKDKKVRNTGTIVTHCEGPVYIDSDGYHVYVLDASRIIGRYRLTDFELTTTTYALPDSSEARQPLGLTYSKSMKSVLVQEEGSICVYVVHALPKTVYTDQSRIRQLCMNGNEHIFVAFDENVITVMKKSGERIDNIYLKEHGMTREVQSLYASNDALFCGFDNGSVVEINLESHEKKEIIAGGEIYSMTLLPGERFPHTCFTDVIGICGEYGVVCFCLQCREFVARMKTEDPSVMVECFNKGIIVLEAFAVALWKSTPTAITMAKRAVLPPRGKASCFKIVGSNMMAVARHDCAVVLYDLDELNEIYQVQCGSWRVVAMGWFDRPILGDVICCVNSQGIFSELSVKDGTLVMSRDIVPHLTQTECIFSREPREPLFVFSAGRSVQVMAIPTMMIAPKVESNSEIGIMEEPSGEARVTESMPTPEITERHTKVSAVRSTERESVGLVFIEGKPKLLFGGKRREEPVPELSVAEVKPVVEVSALPDFVDQSLGFVPRRRVSTATRRTRREVPAGERQPLNEKEFYQAFLSVDVRSVAKASITGRRKAAVTPKPRSLTLTRGKNDDTLQVFKVTTKGKREDIPPKPKPKPAADPRIKPIVARPPARITKSREMRRERTLPTPTRVILTTPRVESRPKMVIQPEEPVPVQQEPVQFSKKAFLEKLNELPPTRNAPGGVSFVNGMALPLHGKNEPSPDVVGSALHRDYTFNAFTEKSSGAVNLNGFAESIEIYCDVLGGASDASRKLLSASPHARSLASIFGGRENQLEAFIGATSSPKKDTHRRTDRVATTDSVFPSVPSLTLTLTSDDRGAGLGDDIRAEADDLPSDPDAVVFRCFDLFRDRDFCC